MKVYSKNENFSTQEGKKQAEKEFFAHAEECSQLMEHIAARILEFSGDVTWPKLGSLQSAKQNLIGVLKSL